MQVIVVGVVVGLGGRNSSSKVSLGVRVGVRVGVGVAREIGVFMGMG